MAPFLSDLRFGVRQLLRQPAFAAAAIGSLALGIGLNTTLFSLVNAVLLRDTSISAPERLVEIYSGISRDYPQLTTSYPDYLDVRAGVPALAGVAANAYVRGILSTSARGVLVTGEAVTPNYFNVLGVPLSIGRAFREDEGTTPGTVAVAVLSHGLWQRQFAGRADIVGQTIKVSGHGYTVIGVAPATFTGTLPGIPTEFWVPVTMVDRLEFSGVQASRDTAPPATPLPRLEQRALRWLFVKGRLAEGRGVEDARTQVETIFARLAKDHPTTNDEVTASVVPVTSVRFHPMLDGYIKAASAVLLAAVGLVLLIACANVANMQLARGAARQRELAIRAAVGAGRGRLLRQLLAESLLLSAVGGAAGIAIAWWAGRALSSMSATVFPMPIAFDVSVDPTVLLFATSVSVLTAVAFGLAPAWSSSRPELVPALKSGFEFRQGRRLAMRDVLVVGQLALSLVLLVAGALLGRGLLAAERAEVGFDPSRVASLSFNLQMNGYDVTRADALGERAIEALGAVPGVTAVSTASRLPLAPDINMEGVLVPGHHRPDDTEGTTIDAVSVGVGYFTAVGIPIVAGRAFTRDDVAASRRVAIVNESMARQFWGDGSPVGRFIHTNGFQQPPHEIVGVARDHKVRSVGETDRPYLHLPARPSRSIGLVVRTASPVAPMLPALRQALWQLEPEIVFTEDVSAEAIADATVAPTRIGAMVLGAFGALALLLAGVGVYGVVAYTVSRRTREVGIRMALGAERRRVLAMMLWQGGRLAVVGIALGATGAIGVGRVLESLLYGVSTTDPLAYAAAAGVLLVAAIAANLLPALSAARIDPMRALRLE